MCSDIPKIKSYDDKEKLFFITDDDGIIQFFSNEHKYILNFFPGNIDDKLHFLQLFTPNCKKEIERRLTEILKKKEKQTGRFLVQLNKQNSKSNSYLNITILQNKSGEQKGFCGEIDCGIRGETERIAKMKKEYQELKELNLSKDKFLSIISHDLKAPFGQFISATQLILDRINEYDTSQIAKLIRMLNKQAVRTYKLLENLLEWSRNQKGLIKFDPEPISLRVLTNEITDSLLQMAVAKSISITSNIKNGLFIYADKYMLSTILRNLISNAIKFTDEHGEVTISTRYLIQKQSLGDKILEVAIADTGVGIREEEIAKLFRIDKVFSTKGTQKEPGTGLGLILCKEFVEKHGGQIWVDSEPGKGSVFKFTIP